MTLLGSLTVLSVSPLEDDHLSLRDIIGHSRWRLLIARDHTEALSLLSRYEVSVVLCECNSGPENWIRLHDDLSSREHPPALIVTSRNADDRLWAEVLNLGGRDVLAKPFDRLEVLRCVKTAWDQWHFQANGPRAYVAKPAV